MTGQIDAILEGLLREVMPRNLARVALHESMTLHGDLGIDSLGLMSLAFRLEEEFQIDLTDQAELVANLQTLAELCELVRGRRDASGIAAGIQEGETPRTDHRSLS